MIIRRANPDDAKRINDLLYQVAKIHADGRPDIFKTATKKYSDDELIEIIKNDNSPIFVAVDENDKPVGYCYGTADYDFYQNNFDKYIRKVESLKDRAFLKDALVEMYDHAIYKNDYPAHLHIDILPDYQSKGIGSKLISAFCNNVKEQNIDGVMLIVGSENEGARRFYERNGFTLLQDIKTGAAYGKKL